MFFKNTSNDYNNKINKSILSDSNEFKLAGANIDVNIKLKKIVNKINTVLKEEIGSVSKTITFKLNNFVLNYNELYGIANTMQSSGSCTFYSYYNLGINMLLIKALNTEKIKEGIELFIKNFIHIHFRMLYLFCLFCDTEYLADNEINYSENNIFNYSYLYKIIKQEDLLGEMIEIYNKPTFLYNLNDQPINKLLNFKLLGSFTEFNLINKIDNTNYYDDLNNYFNNIITRIRKLEINITHIPEIKTELNGILTDIRDKITSSNTFYKESLKPKYFESMAEIYWIYLVILIRLYNNDLKEYYLLTKIDGSNIIKNYDQKNNNEMLKIFSIDTDHDFSVVDNLKYIYYFNDHSKREDNECNIKAEEFTDITDIQDMLIKKLNHHLYLVVFFYICF